MAVEKGAAAAAGPPEGISTHELEEADRLLHKVFKFRLFLTVGSMIAMFAPKLAPATRPAMVPTLPDGYGFRVTCAVFTVATVVVQEMLAKVLERRPAPAPRLKPEAAWPLGVFAWLFVTICFDSYLSFGRGCYFEHTCCEWNAARIASSVNLFMITLTVSDHLLG